MLLKTLFERGFEKNFVRGAWALFSTQGDSAKERTAMVAKPMKTTAKADKIFARDSSSRRFRNSRRSGVFHQNG